jgi:predicted ABC-class ATPase
LGSLVALLHDIFIVLCLFSLFNFEISVAIIAAFLTIVGYSLNDTIVILDRIRELYTRFGISTILVMGGCGDYLDVADHVIMMDAYKPVYVTKQAKEIAVKYQTGRRYECAEPFKPPVPRRPVQGLDPKKERKKKIAAKGLKSLIFGRQTIDLSANEHLKEIGQTLFIGYVLDYYATHLLAKSLPLKEAIIQIEKQIDQHGLDILLSHRAGNLARCRPQEIAFALNRLRSLQVK